MTTDQPGGSLLGELLGSTAAGGEGTATGEEGRVVDLTGPSTPSESRRGRAFSPQESLRGRFAHERRQALHRLRRRSDVEVAVLTPLLADPDPGVRLVAVAAVAEHPRAGWEDLRRAVFDPDLTVRTAAVSAVLRTADPGPFASLWEEARGQGAEGLLLASVTDVFRSAGPDPARLDAVLGAGPVWLPDAAPVARGRLARAIGRPVLASVVRDPDTRPEARHTAEALIAAWDTGGRGRPERPAPVGPQPAAASSATVPGLPPAPTPVASAALPALVLAAEDPDPSVAADAVAALAGADPGVLRAWVEAEVVGQDELATTAARVLAAIPGGGPLLLDTFCAHDRPGLREALVDGLRRHPPAPDAWPALVAAGGPTEVGPRLEVAAAVAGPAALPLARDIAATAEGRARASAFRVLTALGEREAAEQATTALLADESADTRRAAVDLVVWADPLARWRAFEAALRDPDPSVRAAALDRLPAGLGAAALPLVARAVGDRDETVRAAARRALPPGGAAVVALWGALVEVAAAPAARAFVLSALRDADRTQVVLHAERAAAEADPAQRAAAATVWSHVAPGTDPVGRLAPLLGDPSPGVRVAVVDGLCALGTAEAVSTAGRALVDPEPGVRLAAVRALDEAEGDRGVPALVTALRDPAPLVHAEARARLAARQTPAVARLLVSVLGTMAARGPALELLAAMPESALDALLDALPEADDERAGVLRDALVAVGAATRLAGRLAAVDPRTRRAAVSALSLVDGDEARDLLTGALADPDESTRATVARALGRLGDPAVADALRRRLLAEPSPDVVEALKDALRALVGDGA